jgi:phosphoribosylformylglycinamidine synthase
VNLSSGLTVSTLDDYEVMRMDIPQMGNVYHQAIAQRLAFYE